MKKLIGLGLLMSVAAVLSACELYFGNNNEQTWASPDAGSRVRYDAGPGSGSHDPSCTVNADCERGSVCSSPTGKCLPTCVCSSDAEAVDGGWSYCDQTRMTCMSTGGDGGGGGLPRSCGVNTDCEQGAVCAIQTDYNGNPYGQCLPTCTCSSDAQAVKEGWGYCDETRLTCMSN